MERYYLLNDSPEGMGALVRARGPRRWEEAMTKKERISRITALVQQEFTTFGGLRASHNSNPIAAAMHGKPAVFALGVDVEAVVALVLSNATGPVEPR